MSYLFNNWTPNFKHYTPPSSEELARLWTFRLSDLILNGQGDVHLEGDEDVWIWTTKSYNGTHTLFRSQQPYPYPGLYHVKWNPFDDYMKDPWEFGIINDIVFYISEDAALYSESLITFNRETRGYEWEGMERGITLRSFPRTPEEYIVEIIEAGYTHVGPELLSVL